MITKESLWHLGQAMGNTGEYLANYLRQNQALKYQRGLQERELGLKENVAGAETAMDYAKAHWYGNRQEGGGGGHGAVNGDPTKMNDAQLQRNIANLTNQAMNAKNPTKTVGLDPEDVARLQDQWNLTLKPYQDELKRRSSKPSISDVPPMTLPNGTNLGGGPSTQVGTDNL